MADHDIDALLDDQDAVGLAGLVAAGELTARQLAEASIARIEARNGTLNAVVATRFDEALAEADAGPTGPLAGVPFLVKDLGCDVAGLPSTRGSRLWADNVAAEDCELTRRFKAAGLLDPRQHQHPGDGQERQHRAAPARPDPQPVAHHPLGRRLVGRLGRVGRRRHRARRPRQRRRRLDPHPGLVVRAVRAQAHPGPHPGVAGPGRRPLPARHRPRRHPHGPRQRRPARRHRRPGARRRLRLAGRAARGLVRRRSGHARPRPCASPTPPPRWPATRATPPRSPPWSAWSRCCWRSATASRRPPPTYDPAQVTTAMSTIMGAVSAVAIEDRLAELGRELADDDLEALTRAVHDGLSAAPATALVRAQLAMEKVSHDLGELPPHLRPVAHPHHRRAGARARVPGRQRPPVDVHPGRPLHRLHRRVQRHRPAGHVDALRDSTATACPSGSSSPAAWAARPPSCASPWPSRRPCPGPTSPPGPRLPDRSTPG